MFEAVVDYAHMAIAIVAQYFAMYSKVVLLDFPHAQIYPLCANAIAASLKVHELSEGKPKLYWAHSFTLVLITGFGGGFVAPMMLGKPPAPVANDVVLPAVIIAWYTIHYLGFNKVCSFLPIKILWSFFVALFRTHAVCNMVALAAATLKAGPYYPCALMGPIIIGTAVGSLGQFFPTDKGLSAISNGLPWPIQGALMTSVFYHLTVNDTSGFVGIGFRSIFGNHSEASCRVIVATVQIVTLFAQTLLSPSANLFTPFHKLFYLVFQVEGPKGQFQKPGETVGWAYHTRLHLERIIESSRLLAVVAAVGLHLYYTQPKSTLAVNQPLMIGQSIGTCQLLSRFRGCDPYILTLESVPSAGKEKDKSTIKLSSYKSLQNSVLIEASPLWQVVVPKGKSKLLSSEGTSITARLGEDGSLRVLASSAESEVEEQLWVSASKCPAPSATATALQPITLSLDASGRPAVTCADGSVVIVA